MIERDHIYRLRSIFVLLDILAQYRRENIRLVVNRGVTDYKSWEIEQI